MSARLFHLSDSYILAAMQNLSPEQLTTIANWLGTGSINIFGLPFAGKDTHGRELAKLFDGVILGGGDILRNSIIPEHVERAMHEGKLIPISDYIDIVLPYLSRDEFRDKPLVLSSVGRWFGEEKGVLEAAKMSSHPIKAVVYLKLKQEVSYERWKKSQDKSDRSARSDDAEHLLEVRFKEFREKTLPVIEAYRQLSLLIEVDGIPSKAEVSRKILEGLYDHAQREIASHA